MAYPMGHDEWLKDGTARPGPCARRRWMAVLGTAALAACGGGGAPPANALPQASDDSASTAFETSVDIDVLANDTAADGIGALTVSTGAANGTALVDLNGTLSDASDDLISYSPASGFSGSDSFVYTLSDSGGDTDTALVSVTVQAPPPSPVEITIAGVGPQGIFDPSLASDPATGLLWMSYSEVMDSAMWPGQNLAIQTRLAWSGDAGATWGDSGSVINPAIDVVLPLAPPNDAGTWEQEVPALVHDPGAQAAERWKLLWLRYMQVNGAPAFQHSWLALRTAPDPAGPWSPERKLFVGLGYDSINDVTIGPPEVLVHQLDPELSGVLGVAEPGFLATSSALYVTLLAAEGGSQVGRIALLEWPHPGGPWKYVGSFLVNAIDGPLLGYHGFSAPELFEQNGNTYLIATPQTNDVYQGTQVFQVADLESALLERVAGVPVLALEVFGTPGTHNGAAGYVEQAGASGLIYSEVDTTQFPLFFRIFKSFMAP